MASGRGGTGTRAVKGGRWVALRDVCLTESVGFCAPPGGDVRTLYVISGN